MILPRRPEVGNKFYNQRPTGYSTCILGNYPHGMKKTTGFPGLNTLPNCTGYAVGYLNESNGREDFGLIGNLYPPYMIAAAKRQGLEVSDHPTQGGLMIWQKTGRDGHVCVVKRVLDSHTIITAESEWNGAVYAEYTRRKGAGDWRDGCYWMHSSYHFIGCIRNPALEVENMTIDELIDNMTDEQAYKLSQKARKHAQTLPVSSYAEIACRDAVTSGAAADGNGDGLADAPRASLLREEFFVVLKRLGLLNH